MKKQIPAHAEYPIMYISQQEFDRVKNDQLP